MSTKKTADTFALAMVGHSGLVMKLAGNGVEFEQASPEITRSSLRLGVLCLNSGLSESEIVELLESRVA
jgi:hypothetical protein